MRRQKVTRENPLKKLHELDQNASEISVEFTDQNDKFCVN